MAIIETIIETRMSGDAPFFLGSDSTFDVDGSPVNIKDFVKNPGVTVTEELLSENVNRVVFTYDDVVALTNAKTKMNLEHDTVVVTYYLSNNFDADVRFSGIDQPIIKTLTYTFPTEVDLSPYHDLMSHYTVVHLDVQTNGFTVVQQFNNSDDYNSILRINLQLAVLAKTDNATRTVKYEVGTYTPTV